MIYLYSMKTNTQILAKENGKKLNVQITNQLIANGIMRNGKYTGKSIQDVNDAEWIVWIKELMELRDNLWNQYES